MRTFCSRGTLSVNRKSSEKLRSAYPYFRMSLEQVSIDVERLPRLQLQEVELEEGELRLFNHCSVRVMIQRIGDFYICHNCEQWNNATVSKSGHYQKNAKQLFRSCEHIAILRGKQAEELRMQTPSASESEVPVCCNVTVVYPDPHCRIMIFHWCHRARVLPPRDRSRRGVLPR